MPENGELTVLLPGGVPAAPARKPAVRRGRRGQTAVEYLLVTASLLFVFVMMYKALQYALANQFKRGGLVIIRMYKEDPW
ncbi:MAG: hypothetical protein A2049_07430 [Elusimicrobia bacterium GWA2_62_23]|nr:MAG: hypothetical protein A2049_07430 [Elusimicrobia bacterium GWA2_62_23]OGR69457.1 MAG: hypothetical protein A2179_04305 [Elusimicrobia bacterium GWC2_63_65]